MQANALVELLLNLVGNAGFYVLVLLIGLSIWATAIIIERLLYFRAVVPPIADGIDAVRQRLLETMPEAADVPELGRLGNLYQAIATGNLSLPAVDARLQDAAGRLKRDLMRGANILGTLGANAPFIGLLGTVFGIIQAFRDLAETTGKGADAVMGGIAEALVATGMGLLVAIPCVLFYNYFARRAQQIAEQVVEVGNWMAAEQHRDL